MEEDTGSSGSRKGLSPPLISSKVNSLSMGNSNVDGRDARVKLDGAASGIDESEPLLSVTQRIKEKREGERWWIKISGSILLRAWLCVSKRHL